LVQDTAYQSLLKSSRQQLHQQIAQALEQRFTEVVEAQPELLAHHYTEAGLIAQALPYWQRAGQRAIERSANVEAIGHLTKGVAVLQALPDTLERGQQELLLQLALGTALTATQGQAAPEVGKVYTRAYELCQREGDSSQLFTVLRGLRFFSLARGEFRTAQDLSEQLLHLAQRLQDPALLLEAHHALGALLFWRGEFAAAQEHFAHGLVLYDPPQHHTLATLYGYDPGVACLLRLALVLWCLGYPDQALQRCHEALTLAQQETSHPLSSVYTLHHAAWLHQFRREATTIQERAETVVAVSSDQGFALYAAMGTILWGWALTEQGQREKGIAQMRHGLATWQSIRLELLRPYYLALLAEACGTVGQPEQGLAVLAEALAMVSNNGERMWEAELYRLKGQLTLQSQSGPRPVNISQNESAETDPQSEAEACFHKAIEVARSQSAKSLELRAVISLGRLWQAQGKKKEAHGMLAEIHDWFTEGFDTKDLQEAKLLLAELA
jgi:predicted ATPase